jgi:hypothetical protein
MSVERGPRKRDLDVQALKGGDALLHLGVSCHALLVCQSEPQSAYLLKQLAVICGSGNL